METARNLFWEQGYASTGVAQILKESGVGSGSLYHYFPTKEDLMIAVLEWYLANLGTMVIDPVTTRVTDPIERVFGVLDNYRQLLVMTECAKGCPIGNLSLELSDGYPAARRLIAENFGNWRDAIKGFLDGAADRLPEGTNTQALATFVLTTMEGAVMLCRATRTTDPYLEAIDQLRDYFDRLIADGTDWSRAKS
ncbi:MAG: TetR/AcrR family transcriptional regulator [Fimbriimonas sp.]